MAIELSALDLHYLIEEMRFLEGAKVDKIVQPTTDAIVFQFYVRNKGKQRLRIAMPNLIYLTRKKPETAEKQFGFCAALRKYLSNSRLEKIEQAGSERTVTFLFKTKEEEYALVAELFAKGNVVLCKKDLNIIVPLKAGKWKDREIRARAKYSYPKREINFFAAGVDDLKNSLKKQKQTISKALAVDFGFGGQYARELCLLSDIGEKDTAVNDEQIKELFKAIKSLTNKKINPFIVYSDDKIKAVIPFELDIYKDLRKEKQKTFNSAIDLIMGAEAEEKLTMHQKELKRLKKIIDIQQDKIKELQTAAVQNQKKGELIYEKYQLLNQVVDEIKKARKKYSWKQIKEKLRGHKLIKEINECAGEIIIEIE